jgi:hypothetical protein
VESKNANVLNNAAEKNCVHMYQNFLTWVFRFALVLDFLNLKELVGLGKEPMVLWVVMRFLQIC